MSRCKHCSTAAEVPRSHPTCLNPIPRQSVVSLSFLYFHCQVEPSLDVCGGAARNKPTARLRLSCSGPSFIWKITGNQAFPTPILGPRFEFVSPRENGVMSRVPPGHRALGPVCWSLPLPSKEGTHPLPSKSFHLETFSWLLPFPRPLSPLPPTVISHSKCHLSRASLTTPSGKFPGIGYHPLFSPLAKAHSSACRESWGQEGSF